MKFKIVEQIRIDGVTTWWREVGEIEAENRYYPIELKAEEFLRSLNQPGVFYVMEFISKPIVAKLELITRIGYAEPEAEVSS